MEKKADKPELKGNHKTNDPKAVTIEVNRAQFQINNGNLKFTRSQFPIILGYAVTAHKSQGASLKEVLVDFTPDIVNKKMKKPYIIEGSFYVAISRASFSENVYLRDFDPTYIKVKKEIADKIDAMRILRPYKFKKIFNDDQVFNIPDKEMKIGYLNINGLLDANHFQYLNNDKNLLNLDLLALAETKLTKETENMDIQEKLNNFDLVQRFDSNDGKKHMGLLLISPKKSKFKDYDTSQIRGFLDSCTDSQGFVFGMKHIYLKIAFVYIRPNKATKTLINTLLNSFDCKDCDLIMGDFNLNRRNPNEYERLIQLCQEDKLEAVLKEPTTKSYHQPDHILVDKSLKERVFVTSFYNFISDHKSIVARIGVGNNTLLKDIDIQIKKDMMNVI